MTTANLTAWSPSPEQAELRNEAAFARSLALRKASEAGSIHEARAALKAMERADKKIRLFELVQASARPGELLRLSHAALFLMDSSAECPHCGADHSTRWVSDAQAMECDDSRSVLGCESCDGSWSVPTLWLDDHICERCNAVGPVDDLGGEALCEQCRDLH